jgi:ribosomal protein S18 acetylase RimI-like enzyme
VNGVRFPEGFRLERLNKSHARSQFHCGVQEVEDWLASKALQQQEKHLSATKVLLDAGGAIAGYYTLASGQIDFSGLPQEITKRLPKRMLPVAVLAWLGVATAHQGRGIGNLLLAQALRDCHEAGQTFAFVAVILDCLNDAAKAFYQKWEFRELPGHPYRLFLSTVQLHAMIDDR